MVLLVSTGEPAFKHKRYWFSPGVGKIMEDGGQTEVLENYNVIGPAE
jgi:hypothetical protein